MSRLCRSQPYLLLAKSCARSACSVATDCQSVLVDPVALPILVSRHLVQVADLVHAGVELARKASASCGGSKLKDFLEYVESPEFKERADVDQLRSEVADLATQFPLPGIGTQNLQYSH